MARPREFDENTVLDKAMDLFWHKGYEATSIQELIATMGISRGSLYDSFGDKHALFVAVLKRYRQRSHDRFLQTLSQPGPVKVAIADMFYYVVNEALADAKRRGCLMTNSTIELSPHDAEIAEVVQFNQQWVQEALYDALRRGQEQGEIAADTDIRALAQFLFNSLQGLRVVSKTTADRQALENIVSMTLSVVA
ncbi:MAG: TetR/AcrR family transcriptional regulator [Anaerolineae bacterium]|nr:TetR/AcrR family transcriptional regulator [Anaerolineae bacterium]